MNEFKQALGRFLTGEASFTQLQADLDIELAANPADAPKFQELITNLYGAGRLPQQLYESLSQQIQRVAGMTGAPAQPPTGVPPAQPPTGVPPPAQPPSGVPPQQPDTSTTGQEPAATQPPGSVPPPGQNAPGAPPPPASPPDDDGKTRFRPTEDDDEDDDGRTRLRPASLWSAG